MTATIAIIFGIIAFLIVPIIALMQYYSPSKNATWKNILWAIIAIITWPIIPVVLIIRNKNTILNILFWTSLAIWIVTTNIWLVANLNLVVEFLNKYINIRVGS